jgi:hypothetical protein
MRAILFIAVIPAMLATVISCKSKEQKAAENYMNEMEKTVKENNPANNDDQKPNAGSPDIPPDMKSILGEWRLFKKIRDDNGNHKIDEDEENAEIKSNNYMKFNADGTCKFEALMDGTFRIITENDGRKRIAIHDLSGTPYPPDLYIYSVTENELVININLGGGSQFDKYKRP